MKNPSQRLQSNLAGEMGNTNGVCLSSCFTGSQQAAKQKRKFSLSILYRHKILKIKKLAVKKVIESKSWF